MQKVVKPSEVLKIDPDFFKNRPDDVNWKLKVWIDGPDKPPTVFVGVDWEVVSRFGNIPNLVVIDENGKPLFDRPGYEEAPCMNSVVWGRDQDGKVKVCVLREQRPHAFNPYSESPTEPFVYGQTPMGFMDKVFGKDAMGTFENYLAGTLREVSEESGASVILNIEMPRYPFHNPSPSFCRTSPRLYFVEVDLDKIINKKLDHGELIFQAEFISLKELLKRIRIGKGPNGEIYRHGASNSAWLEFIAQHPEFLSQCV